MSDHQRGSVAHRHVQGVLNNTFRLRVQSAGGLVQAQDLRLQDHRAGDAEALLLTARHVGPLVPDVCVVSCREAYDEVMSVGQAGGSLDVVVRDSATASVGEVIPNGGVEEQRLLRHKGHLRVKILGIPSAQANAIHEDLTRVGVVMTEEQGRHGRLAAARGAHQCCHLSLRHLKRHALQDHGVGASGVVELDLTELHMALNLPAVRPRDHHGRAVHELEMALERVVASLQLPDLVAHLVGHPTYLLDQQKVGRHIARGEVPLHPN
mmetsp:Transcript_8378/g.19339  ORF Transcript_8378/g.19339 Transcript_8378/m.19339 type:complete len:266 (-) Transcript_8378:705-1502(-)